MKVIFKLVFLLSLVSIFTAGCNETTDKAEEVNPYEENANYSIYVDYADEVGGDVSDCKQNTMSNLCGFIGNTDNVPQFPCENTESCLSE